MDTSEFQVPDEFELVKFFRGEPIERAVEDGYWCYEVAGQGGMTLRFSLDLLERSVQTELRIGTAEVARVSHEMATRLSTDQNVLRCEFFCADCRTTLTIDRRESYRVAWSTLHVP